MSLAKMNLRRLLLVTAFALALLSSGVFAQNSRLQHTQDKESKIKVKGDRLVARDKSKAVRHALEEQYARIAEAQKNRDIEALRSLRTPDFSVQHIGDVKPGAWIVDGKRVDPTKPYDPDAPPYSPEDNTRKP